jgi:hypothetical protein
MNIGALIVSCGEPQVERCVHSVYKQTIPFANVKHISDVVPEADAINKGIQSMDDEWTMKVDGDFILYENAVDMITRKMKSESNEGVCGWFFGLYDTFLRCDIGYASVLRTSVYKGATYQDVLRDDFAMNRYLRRNGWGIKKRKWKIVGTHFDSPDAFQVFRRFYVQVIKYPHDPFVPERLTTLFMETGDPLYDLGLRARVYAHGKEYPTSRNLDYDRKLFEEFNRS